MVNQENKGKAETFILRGNADIVMRQLVDEYNSSNGWSINRIVNNIPCRCYRRSISDPIFLVACC